MTDPNQLSGLADALPDVSVDRGAVQTFCEAVQKADIRLPDWRGPVFPAEDTADTAAFFLVANAVNFCFWGSPKWTVRTTAGQFDGSFGLFAALTRGLEEGAPLLNGAFLFDLSQRDLAHILRGNVEIPLFAERLGALRELGTVLVRHFDGRPVDLIARAEGDAVRLVDLIVSHLPRFDDRATWSGRAVTFHKRAQLVPAMLHARFRGRSWGRLRRIGRLTVFADYKLPQILREAGILRYSEPLARKVDDGHELPAGGRLEVQIRIGTLWAGELIRRALSARFPDVTAVHVDGLIWAAGQRSAPGRRPYHRTRTLFY